jgi:hypothetical protein
MIAQHLANHFACGGTNSALQSRARHMPVLCARSLDAIDGLMFRRIHDLVVIRSTGELSILISGVRGPPELVPERLDLGGRTNVRFVSRFPALARHFQFVVAADTSVFVLADSNKLEVHTAQGGLRALITLPTWPRQFAASHQNAYSAQDVVPLGILTDADGNLWLEQPRETKYSQSDWFILSQMGELIGGARLPASCRLRGVGHGLALCEARRPEGMSARAKLTLYPLKRSRAVRERL